MRETEDFDGQCYARIFVLADTDVSHNPAQG